MKSEGANKVESILSMIDKSPRFQKEYGLKLVILKKVVPMLGQDLIDKMYAFLLLESNENKDER
jgi:hypothetical protein